MKVLLFVLLLLHACNESGDVSDDASGFSEEETASVPEPISGMNLTFHVQGDIDPESVDGYVVGNQELKIEHILDDEGKVAYYGIKNVPPGEHDVVVQAESLNIALSQQSALTHGRRINNLEVREGIRKNIKDLDLPRGGRLKGRLALSGLKDFTGVDVFIPGTHFIGKTDRLGDFLLENLPVGEHEIAFQYDSYQTLIIENIGIDSDRTTTLHGIKLSPSLGPKGSVSINDGADSSDQGLVVVKIAASDNALFMKVGDENSFIDSSFVRFTSEFSWTFNCEGENKIRIQLKDKDGVESEIFEETIVIINPDLGDCVAGDSFLITDPGSIVNTSTPTIEWEAVPMSMRYDLVIASDSACTSVAQTYPGRTTTLKKLRPLADGTYYICISALTELGSTIDASNNGYKITIDTTAPTVSAINVSHPSSGSPAFHSSLTSSPSISWSDLAIDAGTGVDQYQVAIGSAPSLDDIAPWTTVVNGVTSYVANSLILQDEFTYYASVRAIDLAGNISSSRSSSGWTVDNRVNKISLTSPVDYQITTDSTLTFTGLCEFGATINIDYVNAGTMFTAIDGSYNPSSASCLACDDLEKGCSNSVNGIGTFSFVVEFTATSGNRQVKITQTDRGGNLSLSLTRTIDRPITQISYLKGSVVASPGGMGGFGDIDGATMVIKGSHERIDIYHLNSGSWDLEQSLSTSDVNGFGANSLSVSNDLLVVGHSQDSSDNNNPATNNSNAIDSGAVYIFKRSGNNWSFVEKIKAPVIESQDRFGFSVGIDGDYLVVGAWGEDGSDPSDYNDNGATDWAGAAFVYKWNGSSFDYHAYLKRPQNAINGTGDNFGYAVDISGSTIVVGVPGDYDGPNGEGAKDGYGVGSAYVFSRSGSNWSKSAYLKPLVSNNMAVGWSVAISGDLIVLGRGRTTAAPTESGSSFVYRRSNNTWNLEATLAAANSGAGDGFGSYTAIDGNTIVIGAPWEDSVLNGSDASSDENIGAAYVFKYNGSSWVQHTMIKASNGEHGVHYNNGVDAQYKGDQFGTCVSVDGEYILVGAPNEDSAGKLVPNDNSSADSGAAYIFR